MAAVLDSKLPSVMTLMLQKEAAQRYAAKAGGKQFGSISIFLQAAFEILPGHDVSGACFYPKPDVGSTLLHLRLKAKPYLFSQEGRELAREVFQQRRKQISSLLKQSKRPLSDKWLAQLEQASIAPNARPEQIEVAQWIQLDAE